MIIEAYDFMARGLRYMVGPSILVLLVVVLAYATSALMTAIVLQDARYARREYVQNVLEQMYASHAAIMDNSKAIVKRQEVAREEQIQSLKLFILEAELRGLDLELSRTRAQMMPSRDYFSDLLARRNALAAKVKAMREQIPTGGKP